MMLERIKLYLQIIKDNLLQKKDATNIEQELFQFIDVVSEIVDSIAVNTDIIGDLASLLTDHKSNIISAINELHDRPYETTTNRVDALDESTSHYPSCKAVFDAISELESYEQVVLHEGQYNSQGVPTIVGQVHKLYFVPAGDSSSHLFEEWAYINNAWEHLGAAQINMEDYAKKDFVQQIKDQVTNLEETQEAIEGAIAELNTPIVVSAGATHVSSEVYERLYESVVKSGRIFIRTSTGFKSLVTKTTLVGDDGVSICTTFFEQGYFRFITLNISYTGEIIKEEKKFLLLPAN